MTIITLTTDFGLRDGFVGIMKGVIYGIAPQAKIVDISHTIAPQNVHEGAFTLWRAVAILPCWHCSRLCGRSRRWHAAASARGAAGRAISLSVLITGC